MGGGRCKGVDGLIIGIQVSSVQRPRHGAHQSSLTKIGVRRAGDVTPDKTFLDGYTGDCGCFYPLWCCTNNLFHFCGNQLGIIFEA